ncbi:FtsW/RodA/SpoVE family cell cycle protein [Hydrogenobacter hydrogenophilus]|uniref:Probable peptidoglycan glycosyltransferase FtsW n=1 Tax=Hydrogenobacter hydrogenophilus TaxID=35835 RepID=A0A285P0Q0_9AQUI|nr:FtsW/RodA/SpoVE family cell cycle protein [Hydrogenobacter hydrogenophilus]SNZ13726.1 cell division protein FtsW [Hydrogenobacter hydrogenophilus]
MDRWILYAVILLFIIGETVIISSNLLPYVFENYRDLSIYKKPIYQLLTFLLGMFLISKKFDYLLLKKKSVVYSFVSASTLMLMIVLVKKYITHRHVDRWLIGTSLQPLEFTKVALVIFIAYYLVEKGSIKEWRYILWASFLVLINAFLISLQPDKGGAVFLLLLCGTLLYVGGIPKKVYIPILMLFVLFTLYILTSKSGYVAERFSAWKDPFADPEESGYQIIQSLFAFAHGGLWGVGIGKGLQKMGALPAADTDYVISLIGEEFGFIGILLVFCLYSILVGRLLYFTYKINEPFGKLLLFGIAMNFAIAFLWNVGMAVNLLPPKGIALPLLSYGPSNLLFSLIAIWLAKSVISRGSFLPRL